MTHTHYLTNEFEYKKGHIYEKAFSRNLALVEYSLALYYFEMSVKIVLYGFERSPSIHAVLLTLKALADKYGKGSLSIRHCRSLFTL